MLYISRLVRTQTAQISLCVALLACVLAVSCFPGTNLPPTALRALRNLASLVFQLSLISTALAVVARAALRCKRQPPPVEDEHGCQPCSPRSVCVLRC